MAIENQETRFQDKREREVVASEARNALAQEARVLYECWPGGPIVTKPTDCPPASERSFYPDVKITGV